MSSDKPHRAPFQVLAQRMDVSVPLIDDAGPLCSGTSLNFPCSAFAKKPAGLILAFARKSSRILRRLAPCTQRYQTRRRHIIPTRLFLQKPVAAINACTPLFESRS